jgi:methionyl-tRNA formyltransferase
MISAKNLIAIGRSRYLYDAITHLVKCGYTVKAIITEEAYEEYDIKVQDFKDLATNIGASFSIVRALPTDSVVELIKTYNIQAAISANWKFTLSEDFLNLFKGGVLNFHLGNLPDYKGNATVNWSIINSEKFINANIHKMDPELDAGDIITREAIPITADTYISDIITQAERIAPLLFEKALNMVLEDPHAYEVKGTTQGLRCFPRLPEDSQIDWNQNPELISRIVRASSYPYKGAYSFINGEKITIWKARPIKITERLLAVPGHIVKLNKTEGSVVVACNRGLMEVQEIEYNGKKLLPADLIKSIRLRFKYLPHD